MLWSMEEIFWSAIKSGLKTYDNIWIIEIGQGDDYTTGCLLDNPYFKEHYKLFVISLSKQQVPDADLKAIQQINFTVNLERDRNTQTLFRLFKRNRESIIILFCFNIMSI